MCGLNIDYVHAEGAASFFEAQKTKIKASSQEWKNAR